MKLILTALLTYGFSHYFQPPNLLAKDSTIKKDAPRKRGPLSSYKACRKAAVRSAKKEKNKKKQIKLIRKGISNCRDLHPSAAVLIECKKDAAKSYAKSNRDYLPTALKKCKDLYKRFQFSQKKSIPFRVHNNDIYFGGVGLNNTVDLKKGRDDTLKMSLANYDCKNIEDIVNGKTTPQYLLFGNDPKHYLPLKQTPQKSLISKLEIDKDKTKSIRIDQYLGQVYWDKSKKNLTNYFPSGFCTYSAKRKGIYEGLKIYYLIDIEKKAATPYFGVAFYKSGLSPKYKKLTVQTARSLGKDHRNYSYSKDFVTLSKQPFKTFDHEGDPRDLCKFPRKQDTVVNIAPDKSGKNASYLILSRVSNLCRHGDKLANRLLKSGLK